MSRYGSSPKDKRVDYPSSAFYDIPFISGLCKTYSHKNDLRPSAQRKRI